jgi:predicted ester cyclase
MPTSKIGSGQAPGLPGRLVPEITINDIGRVPRRDASLRRIRMSTADQSTDTGPAGVYRGFIEAVNRQDLQEAGRFVDAARYRENCVGFTHGFVGWDEAKESVRQVWKGLPDLRVELAQILADGDVALAHGTVRGTATGRLYGAPATRRSFQASFFDYVRVQDGQIIERVQQADVLTQMRQLYGKAPGPTTWKPCLAGSWSGRSTSTVLAAACRGVGRRQRSPPPPAERSIAKRGPARSRSSRPWTRYSAPGRGPGNLARTRTRTASQSCSAVAPSCRPTSSTSPGRADCAARTTTLSAKLS